MSGALKMNLKNIPQKNVLLLFGCSLLKRVLAVFFLKSVQVNFQKPIQNTWGCWVRCVNIGAFNELAPIVLLECGLQSGHISLAHHNPV